VSKPDPDEVRSAPVTFADVVERHRRLDAYVPETERVLMGEVARLRALLTEAVGALADLGACPDADCPRCESVMARCIAALEES
jgi:hypothetical protein